MSFRPYRGLPARSGAGASCLRAVAILLAATGTSFAAADAPADTSAVPAPPSVEEPAEPAESPFAVDVFPPEVRTLGVIWVPDGGYDDEDGIGLGVNALVPFDLGSRSAARLSEVEAEVVFTTKGHKELRLTTTLNWRDHTVRGRADYEDLVQRFWGVGPTNPGEEETYRPRNVLVYAEYLRLMRGDLRLGIRAEWNSWELISFAEDEGEFASGAVPGQDESLATGFGFLLDWDTRPRRYQPTRGHWLQGFSLYFSEALGGDQTFTLYNLEWRGYHAVGGRHVVASQLFTYTATGSPPFWRMAELGGRHHSRGFRRGRYRDRTMVAGQFEWRYPLRGAFGGVAFAGLAAVGADYGDIGWRYVRPTLGAGLRYVIGRGDELVPLRVDAAFSKYGMRLSLGIGDAF
ncbi:MAG: BamA/TamA family outer membrane protein [Candidatus Krumholzibacteriia bacterium]